MELSQASLRDALFALLNALPALKGRPKVIPAATRPAPASVVAVRLKGEDGIDGGSGLFGGMESESPHVAAI